MINHNSEIFQRHLELQEDYLHLLLEQLKSLPDPSKILLNQDIAFIERQEQLSQCILNIIPKAVVHIESPLELLGEISNLAPPQQGTLNELCGFMEQSNRIFQDIETALSKCTAWAQAMHGLYGRQLEDNAKLPALQQNAANIKALGVAREQLHQAQIQYVQYFMLLEDEKIIDPPSKDATVDMLEDYAESLTNQLADLDAQRKTCQAWLKRIASNEEASLSIQVISENLAVKKQQLQAQLESLDLSYPLTMDALISGADYQPPEDTLPKKRVEVFLYTHPKSPERKFLGITSDGHMALKIIDETKPPLCIDLIYRQQQEREDKPTPIDQFLKQVLHMPGMETREGVFLSEELARENNAACGYEEQKVIFDCTGNHPQLNIDAMYDEATTLLDNHRVQMGYADPEGPTHIRLIDSEQPTEEQKQAVGNSSEILLYWDEDGALSIGFRNARREYEDQIITQELIQKLSNETYDFWMEKFEALPFNNRLYSPLEDEADHRVWLFPALNGIISHFGGTPLEAPQPVYVDENKDFYDYNFYTQNCSVVVAELIATGLPEDVTQDKLLESIGIHTPRRVFNFCSKNHRKLQQEKSERIQNLGPEHDPKSYWASYVAGIVSRVCLSNDAALEHYIAIQNKQIQLPSLEELEKLSRYGLQHIDRVIEILLTVFQGIKQAIEKPNLPINQVDHLLRYTDDVLSFIRTKLHIKLTANQDDHTIGKEKLSLFCDAVTQDEQQRPNKEACIISCQCRVHAHALQRHFANLPKSSLTEFTQQANNNEEQQEEQESSLSDIDLLFRASGIHIPYDPNLTDIAITLKKEEDYDDQDSAAREKNKEFHERLETLLGAVENALTNEDKAPPLLKGKTSLKKAQLQFLEKQEIINLAMLPVINNDKFNLVDAAPFYFDKLVLTRHAIRLFEQEWYNKEQQEARKDGSTGFTETERNQLYQEPLNLLKTLRGQYAQKVYFPDQTRANQGTNTNLLRSAIKALLEKPPFEETPNFSLLDLFDNSKKADEIHNAGKYALSRDDINAAKGKHTVSNKPSVFNLLKWGKRRELFRLECNNRVVNILNDEALSPHAKLQNVLYLIKRYSPAPFAFWRTKERKAYQATMEKAGLHCLLEGFTQGDMDEAQFLNKLAELHEHLDAPSTELNDFSIHFRTIYKDKITDQLNRTWIERNEDVKNPTLNLANEKQEEWKKLQGNTQIQRYCPNYHKTLTKALEAYERESKKKPVDVDNLMKFERKLTR